MIDEKNNVCRMLQKIEIKDLKSFAPLINWGEHIERQVFKEVSLTKDNTRDVLYKELSELQLIELIHPNMFKGPYNRPEDIPFTYAFTTKRVEFLKAYIESFELEYDMQKYCDASAIKKALISCIKANYRTDRDATIFGARDEQSINEWYDMVLDIVDVVEAYEKVNYYYSCKDVRVFLEELRKSSLFLINKSDAPKNVDESMLAYAVEKLNVEHMLGTAYESSVVNILEEKFKQQPRLYYGDTYTSYEDKSFFESEAIKDLKQQEHFISTLNHYVAAGAFKLTKDTSDTILLGLANRCPVMFFWAKEHFPNHKFEVSGKKYSYKQIEGIYGYSYLVNNKSSVKGRDYSLAIYYDDRRLQYKAMGYALPTVEGFAVAVVNVALSNYPGLKETRTDIQREKFNLELEIKSTGKKGKYKL